MLKKCESIRELSDLADNLAFKVKGFRADINYDPKFLEAAHQFVEDFWRIGAIVGGVIGIYYAFNALSNYHRNNNLDRR
jgi:hypothetical protein